MGTEFDSTLGHYVEMCSKLGIFLDFDGTMSPLARTPELAFIPPETKKVWERDTKYYILLFNCCCIATQWLKIAEKVSFLQVYNFASVASYTIEDFSIAAKNILFTF